MDRQSGTVWDSPRRTSVYTRWCISARQSQSCESSGRSKAICISLCVLQTPPHALRACSSPELRMHVHQIRRWWRDLRMPATETRILRNHMHCHSIRCQAAWQAGRQMLPTTLDRWEARPLQASSRSRPCSSTDPPGRGKNRMAASRHVRTEPVRNQESEHCS